MKKLLIFLALFMRLKIYLGGKIQGALEKLIENFKLSIKNKHKHNKYKIYFKITIHSKKIKIAVISSTLFS